MGEVGSMEIRLASVSVPTIRHANQGSLGKGQVEQGGADREGRAQADLFDEQERRDRPQLIERQDEGEHLTEFFAQPLVVEAHRRNQVQAQRNADAGGDQHSAGESCSRPKGRNESPISCNVTQEKQRRRDRKHRYIT